MQQAMSFNNIAIVYVKGNAYIIHFWYMSKIDAINIKNGSNLADKRDRAVILNRAKDYYENDKERLREQVRDKYRSLSEEEKNNKTNMGRIDTTKCLKKRNKDEKNIKKIIVRQGSLNIIVNKLVFNCDLVINKIIFLIMI